MLAGAHFTTNRVIELAKLGNRTRSNPVTIKPSQTTQSSYMFTLPSDTELWAYEVRVYDGTQPSNCSNKLEINVADLWWASGDAGNKSTAGGWLRLFGTGLDFHQFHRNQSAGQLVLLEQKLKHAVRSRDAQQIQSIAKQLSDLLGGEARASWRTQWTHRYGCKTWQQPQQQLQTLCCPPDTFILQRTCLLECT